LAPSFRQWGVIKEKITIVFEMLKGHPLSNAMGRLGFKPRRRKNNFIPKVQKPLLPSIAQDIPASQIPQELIWYNLTFTEIHFHECRNL
jgi:hypothetical protein